MSLPPVSLTVVVLVAGFVGCLSDSPQESPETPTPGDVATYEVQGPIYSAGFWPTRDFEYIEDTTIRIELGSNQTVMDAAGRLVDTINVTLRTEEYAATQYVAPQTGQVVVTEMPFPQTGGRHWDWRSSGTPALWGLWHDLFPDGETWPANVSIPCCPRSEAIQDKDRGISNLTLVDVEPGPAQAEWRFNDSGPAWSPPEPRPVNPVSWNQHHPPADAYELNFTLEDALTALRDNDSVADQWFQDHSAWQLTSAIYVTSLQSTGEEEWTWVLVFHAEDGETLGRQIAKHQTAELIDEYEADTFPALNDLWRAPPSLGLQDGTETWARLWETLGDRVAMNHYAQLRQRPTPAGLDWQGCVDLGPGGGPGGYTLFSRLCQDLETGLWGWMRGEERPRDVLWSL